MIFKVIDFGDFLKTAENLEQGAERATEMAPAMEKVASLMLIAEAAFITSGGRRGGGSWARLKSSTVKKKGSTKILFTDGANPGYSTFGNDALVKSLTERDAEFQDMVVTNSSVEFGTSHPAAEIINNGGRYIRARPLIKFTANDIRNWQQIFVDDLMAPFR